MMYTMTRPMYRNMMDLAAPLFDFAAPSFRVDIRTTENGWQLKADLPGVKREDLDVSLTQDVLTIRAAFGEEKQDENGYMRQERRSGSFTRSFTLENVDADRITASYMDGVLTLDLPRVQSAEPEVRHIAIGGPADSVA